jgi:hypothetical protein
MLLLSCTRGNQETDTQYDNWASAAGQLFSAGNDFCIS